MTVYPKRNIFIV